MKEGRQGSHRQEAAGGVLGKPKTEWTSQARPHLHDHHREREDQQDSELVEHEGGEHVKACRDRAGDRPRPGGQTPCTSASKTGRDRGSPHHPTQSPVWQAWPSGTRTKPGAHLHSHALDVSGADQAHQAVPGVSEGPG